MQSSIRVPSGISSRGSVPSGSQPGIRAGLAAFPWRRAAWLSCVCAVLGASLWWVWW